MAIESPVLSYLETLGARRDERAGYVTAAHFGDPLSEYGAVRRSVGLVDMSQIGVVRIGGKDRVSFLENMLTCGVRNLSPGEGRPAALLTTKGKFVAFFLLLAFPEFFLALVERSFLGALIRGLDHFLILEEVELQDEAARLGVIHVAGPGSGSLLTAASESSLPHVAPGHSVELLFAGLPGPAWAVKDCSTGEEGYHLVVPRGSLTTMWKALLAAEEPKAVPVGIEPFHLLRLEAGTPWPGVDVGPEIGPIEAGLEEAVSFSKGCYPGQEVVSKMTHRGRPPKRLVGLEVEGDEVPRTGAPVLSGEREVGRITTSGLSPALGRVIALGLVLTSALEKEELLRVGDPTGPRARAAELPFR
jgi:aminomethyltransferase